MSNWISTTHIDVIKKILPITDHEESNQEHKKREGAENQELKELDKKIKKVLLDRAVMLAINYLIKVTNSKQLTLEELKRGITNSIYKDEIVKTALEKLGIKKEIINSQEFQQILSKYLSQLPQKGKISANKPKQVTSKMLSNYQNLSKKFFPSKKRSS